MKTVLTLLILFLTISSIAQRPPVLYLPTISLEKDGFSQDSLNSLNDFIEAFDQNDLTATIGMRNMNNADTIYTTKAGYFDTKGNPIITYFDENIYIAPLETVEIIIDQKDQEGGTGANFIFNWTIKPNLSEPYFEAIMISTSGQQGISFTTQGKKIN